MNPFSKIRKNLFSIFQTALIGLLVVLVVVFVVVMFPENPEWIFNLLGIAQNGEPKYETLKFLGIGMGGVLVALQALMSYKRAKAMEETANAQVKATKEQAKANQHTEQGQRQDRLKNAIEHLGHEKDSVRLGGAYELFHLAEDTEELRQTVLDILCAHIRQTTGESEYRETHKFKPSEEVQSLLTLLFVQKHEVFKYLQVDLQGIWLRGANLQEARLEKAVLSRAHLQKADFGSAQLQGVNLNGAYLTKADFREAQLQGANLNGTYLLWVDFREAQLQGANLNGAYLPEADLKEAQLQGANLNGAQLQGAMLSKANLQGVQSDEYNSLPFLQLINKSIGKESDLSNIIFAKGLYAGIVKIFIEGLPAYEAEELHDRLDFHIGGFPSNQLPEDNGAIIGSYTAEEAEKWIAKYEQVMSEVQENNS